MTPDLLHMCSDQIANWQIVESLVFFPRLDQFPYSECTIFWYIISLNVSGISVYLSNESNFFPFSFVSLFHRSKLMLCQSSLTCLFPLLDCEAPKSRGHLSSSWYPWEPWCWCVVDTESMFWVIGTAGWLKLWQCVHCGNNDHGL